MLTKTQPILIAGLVCAAAPSAKAQLSIHLAFDQSVTNSANSAQIQSACSAAAAMLQNAYTDPITINIRVVAAPGTSILGQSQSSTTGPYSYAQMRDLLSSHARTPDDVAAVATLGASDPSGGSFELTTAQAKALGQLAANSPTIDGTFTFGAGLPFTFDPGNRSVPGSYDFIAVALTSTPRSWAASPA